MSTPLADAAIAVSVIVPARNEEACMGACLRSLVEQGGVSREIIVVDDGSTDRTHEIAASFAGVQVVGAESPPAGWTGKNNAMITGARVAHGRWLLFTDADTVHRPGSLARSIIEAELHGASLLSYSPEQEVESLAEKAIMPVIFAELASTYRPAEVNDPDSPVAAANGQYLLISREAYDAIGGHAAVAASLLEDVAVAKAVKASGRKIFFRFGGDAVRTRMYRSFTQLREGWTKNLALLFASPARLALVRLGEFVAIMGCGIAAVIAALYGRPALAAVFAALFLLLYGRFFLRIRKAHFPWDSTLLALVGLPFFAYLLLRSRISYSSGGVSWKGRTYAGAPSAPAKTQMKPVRRSA